MENKNQKTNQQNQNNNQNQKTNQQNNNQR